MLCLLSQLLCVLWAACGRRRITMCNVRSRCCGDEHAESARGRARAPRSRRPRARAESRESRPSTRRDTREESGERERRANRAREPRRHGRISMFKQPRTHPINRHRLPPSMGSFRQSQGPTALGRGDFPWLPSSVGSRVDVVSEHANTAGLLDDEVLVVLLGAIEWCSRSLCRAIPRAGGRRAVI